MTAIRATVNPPIPGMMCAKNDPIPATRLTIAKVLVPAPAEVYIGPTGPGGTEGEGAACCPAICVGLLNCGGGGGGWAGAVLTAVKFTVRASGWATGSRGWPRRLR